jgi:UrcA family protein
MRLTPRTVLAAAGLAAAAWSAPAFAQSLDELTVTGHALRSQPQSLSETVSFADLDLTLAADRSILERRINAAAGRVCDQLNEPRTDRTNLGHSCQDIAVRNAMPQVRLAFADARAPARFARAPAAGGFAAQASATVASREGMAPIPDTRANRTRFGGPASASGRKSHASGN